MKTSFNCSTKHNLYLITILFEFVIRKKTYSFDIGMIKLDGSTLDKHGLKRQNPYYKQFYTVCYRTDPGFDKIFEYGRSKLYKEEAKRRCEA